MIPTQRSLGLDLLRGIAVILMIQQHLISWIWQVPTRQEDVNLIWVSIVLLCSTLGGGAAPTFITLAGIGSMLLVCSRLKAQINPDGLLIKRGITLLILGYILNIITPGWFSWASWFVLHLMGLGMVLTPILRRLSPTLLIALALAIFFSTGLVQHALETPKLLSNHRMAGWAVKPESFHQDVAPVLEFIPYGFWRIIIAEGQFPIFPWLGFFIIGLVCGLWVHQQAFKKITVLALFLLAIGIVIGAASFSLKPEEYSLLWRLTHIPMVFFPSSMALSCLLLGVVLLIVRWAFLYEIRKPFKENSFVITLGRASLTLLFIHVPLFREIGPYIGLYHTLSEAKALLFVAAFLMLCAYITRFWQNYHYRFGAEWLLRKVSR